MNKLNVQQIILLCLLVSFVTSIATGISVVSLMRQEPEPITKTINRVVERTIERVVEPDKEENKKEEVAVVVPEKEIVKVVVSNEQIANEAVSAVSGGVVRIYTDESSEDFEDWIFRGIGVVVDESGTVITDSIIIDPYVGSGFKYYAKVAGSFVEMESVDDASDFLAILKPAVDQSFLEKLPVFKSVKISESNNLKLAQDVISISGENTDLISRGAITEILFSEEQDGGQNTPFVTKIRASIDERYIKPGSLLIDLNGELIGIYSELFSSEKGVFKPTNVILSLTS